MTARRSSGKRSKESRASDIYEPLAHARLVLVVRLRHLAVVERFVERGLVHAGVARDLAQRPARAGGLLDDLSGLVVADVGVERGRGGERQLGVALAVLAVGLDPVDALLREQPCGGRE